MNIRSRTEKPISEQAAEWSAILESGGAREHAAFAAWLRESPHHVREYLLMTALERELSDTDLHDLDVESISLDANKNVVPLSGSAEQSSASPRAPKNLLKRRVRWAVSIAAGLAVFAIAALYWSGSREYTTAIGEQRVFELGDGTVVQLNPLSRIEARLTDRARDITLLEGEALFKVKHDAARPFRVHSGKMLIEDIGTQFYVQRRTNDTVVSVIEGAVDVSTERDEDEHGSASPQQPLRIDAGQEARMTPDGKAIHRGSLNATQLSSLRQRHLTFSGDTLADIVADFNRYNRAPQIRIEGHALQAKRYSGGFDADDPESLIEFLASDRHLTVERRGNEFVIRQRSEMGAPTN